jgi:ABC-2 type transport system ATP-binding protein
MNRPPNPPIGRSRVAVPVSIVGGMATEHAVVVRGLHKAYGEVEAVAGVDLTISRGEVFALLGPNGAGKTTTVEILEGYRRRTAGNVTVLGVDPEAGGRAFRERIGIVSQESSLGPDFTVAESIELYSAAYPEPLAVQEAASLVGLENALAQRTRNLSGGQRRRLDLAIAVAGNPQLLFLDEPTTGFDPSARRRSWQLVENLRSLGTTILLTTHYMDEAQNLADRVAVMAHGRVVAQGPPQILAGRDDGVAVIQFRLPEGVDAGALPLPSDAEVEITNGIVSFRTESPTAPLMTLLGWASARGLELHGLTVTRPSLEDVYLALTAEEAA